MSADGIGSSREHGITVDYVKVRPTATGATVVRGKDDIITPEVPDVVVSISDAARTALAGLTAAQIYEIGRYRSTEEAPREPPSAPPQPVVPQPSAKDSSPPAE